MSTAHFGERRYFEQILATVDAYEQRGFVVHLEGTAHDPAVDAPTGVEQAILAAQEAPRELEQRRMTTTFGWVSQREELRRPSWTI
ncbi:hypothetical protein AB0D32_03710 [Micromonospora sp. NPDC048170]|uniref:hypothetical protein n=1 Tax=Micromonospora sp. NPDC048170 TaxID=3154819 RepID=UPI0033FEA1DF